MFSLLQNALVPKLVDKLMQFIFINSLWHRCFPVNFAKFLRTPVLQNTSGRLLLDTIFEFHALTGCDTTSNFYGVGKIKTFQKIMENTYILTLISNLGHIASANDYIIKNCEIFIQTVLYNGA